MNTKSPGSPLRLVMMGVLLSGDIVLWGCPSGGSGASKARPPRAL